MKRKAIYAASFDPVTNGHLWVVEQGARLFDELIVAIGTNPDKRYTFSLEERVELLRDATVGYRVSGIETYENRFLVSFARSAGAQYILRGIRTEMDYEYERTLMRVNSDLDPGITTVFLMPPREIAEVSSSMVMGLVGLEGWEDVISRFVPDPVRRKLVERFGGRGHV